MTPDAEGNMPKRVFIYVTNILFLPLSMIILPAILTWRALRNLDSFSRQSAWVALWEDLFG